VTWGFCYLAIFLLGFTLALVSGLARRLLHPAELCDGVVVPSHEHWARFHTPRTDLLVSFLTFFGLTTLVLQGTTTITHTKEVLFGIAVGLMGALLFRTWLCKTCDPSRGLRCSGADARVVKSIPPNGFGQVEVKVGSCHVKLAARSELLEPIAQGSEVTILQRQESVVIVRPVG